MLVLSRKVGERIVIGGQIAVVVNSISGNRVSLAIEAPAQIRVVRGELQEIRDEFRSPSRADVSPLQGETARRTGCAVVTEVARRCAK